MHDAVLQAGLVQEGQPLQLVASLRVLGTSGGGPLAAALLDAAGSEIARRELQPGRANLTAPAAGHGRYSLW